MVRQRKCHTRMRKGQIAALSGEGGADGQPHETKLEDGMGMNFYFKKSVCVK